MVDRMIEWLGNVCKFDPTALLTEHIFFIILGGIYCVSATLLINKISKAIKKRKNSKNKNL